MNSADTLSDGSVPLCIWLANAVVLAAARAEGRLLRHALDRALAAHGLQPRDDQTPPGITTEKKRLADPRDARIHAIWAAAVVLGLLIVSASFVLVVFRVLSVVQAMALAGGGAAVASLAYGRLGASGPSREATSPGNAPALRLGLVPLAAAIPLMLAGVLAPRTPLLPVENEDITIEPAFIPEPLSPPASTPRSAPTARVPAAPASIAPAPTVSAPSAPEPPASAVLTPPAPVPVPPASSETPEEALRKIAAMATRRCKQERGVVGSGRVKVALTPDGAVRDATILDRPFVGTPVGACVVSLFRGARVSPFDGAPQSMITNFKID